MGGGDRLPFCRPGLPQLHSARGGRRSAGHRQRTDGRNKQQQKKINGLCLLFNISRYLFYFILFYFIWIDAFSSLYQLIFKLLVHIFMLLYPSTCNAVYTVVCVVCLLKILILCMR